MKSAKTESQDNQLIAHLWNKMSQLQETPRDLASNLKISYVYFMALSRGEREVERADRKVFVEAARYLDIPVAQAFLLGGALIPSDFMVESSIEKRIEHNLDMMRNDPAWCGFVPSAKDLKNTPEKSKILIGLLYERMSQAEAASVLIGEHA